MRIAKTISLFELMRAYPAERDAVSYLEEMRWGSKLACVRCGSGERVQKHKSHVGRYWCGACRKYFNALTNTPLESGRMDARKWLFAAYLLVTARKGISSLQLSKELSITQKTAWYMLHRLRLMCGSKMEALHGEVEVDETYLGGKEANKHAGKKLHRGRGAVGKQAVLGLRERTGRVQAMPIQQTDKNTIQGEIGSRVAPGSTVYTDEHRAYLGLGEEYRHKSVNHSAKEFVNAMAHTNGIDSVWAVLKRGFNGTYHKWSVKHCRRYVDEFTFRLNEGNCQVDTQDRLDSLFRNMGNKKVTYQELVS